jgi:Xaa-Pro aminopeptidase
MVPYARRRDDLARAVRAAGLDALLVAKACNVSYLTGFTGDSSYVLVTPSRVVLVSDDRFRTQIGEECPDLDTHIRGHDRNTYQAVGDVVTKLGLSNVGVEASGVTLEAFEKLKAECKSANLAGSTGVVEKLREVKDETEVAAIREAIRVAEQGFAALSATLRPTDTEKDLGDLLDAYVRRAGGDGMAFPTIIGVGERSALPHANLSARRVESAPFFLVDWGARKSLYHSDLTRVRLSASIRWSRDVESRLERMYTVVLEAQARAIAALRPGVDVKVVDAAARRYIAEAGFGDYFTHGLGHGIGLEVHEAPAVRSNSDDVLRAGMVVTIEPGVYLPDFAGVRIEDDVLITPDGSEVLTSVPKDWGSL